MIYKKELVKIISNNSNNAFMKFDQNINVIVRNQPSKKKYANFIEQNISSKMYASKWKRID